jgi:pyruvate, water dikinase
MIRYIRFLDEIAAQDLSLVGGKGANLGEMTRTGLPAAPGFCLTAGAYRDFIAQAGLAAPIDALLAGLDADDADEHLVVIRAGCLIWLPLASRH